MIGVDQSTVICDHCLRLVVDEGMPEGWVSAQLLVHGDAPEYTYPSGSPHEVNLLFCSPSCVDGWFAAATKCPADNANLREGETADAREALDVAEARENERRSREAWAAQAPAGEEAA